MSTHKNTELKNAFKKFNFRHYYNMVKDWKDDQIMPLTWRHYWAFKECCGMDRSSCEYTHLTDYLEGIEKGDIEWPSFFNEYRKSIPDTYMFPHLHFVECSEAINGSKGIWKIKCKIELYDFLKEKSFMPDNYELTNWHNQVFNWCLHNVKGKFYFSEFAFGIEVMFSDPKDAVLYRLIWGEYCFSSEDLSCKKSDW